MINQSKNKFIFQIVMLLNLMLFLAIPTPAIKKEWSASIVPLALLRADWDETAPLAYYDGKLYVASRRGIISSVDAQNGTVIWSKKMKRAVPGGLSADESGVYFGVSDGTFRCLSTEKGEEKWRLTLSSALFSQPVVSDGTVFFLTGDDILYAVDARSGEWKWRYRISTRKDMTILGLPTPLVIEEQVIAGFSNGVLVGFDKNKGEERWGTRISDYTRFEDLDATPARTEGVIFAASYEGGIAAVPMEGGKPLWKIEGGSYQQLAVSEDYLIYTGRDNKLHAVNIKNGQEIWTAEAPKNAKLTGPSIFTTKTLCGDSLGNIHIYETATGKKLGGLNVWGGVRVAPLVVGDKIFVLTGRGAVYRITL
mgnify:CR=1 FL=1